MGDWASERLRLKQRLSAMQGRAARIGQTKAGGLLILDF